MAKRGIPIIEVLESGDTASGLVQFVQTTAGDVQVKTPSGVQTIATSNTVASAVAKITVKNWAASTAMDADEVRRATVAAGTIEAGDLIRSNSARTTGATFDAAEAGNWTEISPDLVTSVAGRTGAVVLAASDVGLLDGSVQALLDTMRADSVHFLADATNLDTLTTTGWYNVNNATNGPAGGGWYYLFHGTHRNTATGAPTTAYGFQLAKRLNAAANNLLMRVQVNGSWTGWATLATTDAATTTVAGLMSAADKTKLDGVATGAEANAQADWTQTTTTADSFILNKPTIPAATTINDTLTSTSTTEALSANQGRALDVAKAALASPTFTGTPAAPTATAGTNTTQIATTAFINTALTGGGVSAQFDELRYDRVRPLTGTDLNVLTTAGFYDGNNLTNAPGGSIGWFYIEHLQHSNVGDLNWRMQKAYGLGSPNSGFSAAGIMYIRTMVSGVWQAWRTVTTT